MLAFQPGIGPDARYKRRTLIDGTVGDLVNTDVPFADLLKRADTEASNPWYQLEGSTHEPWDITNSNLGLRLKRAAALERFGQTQPVNATQREDFNSLRMGHEILADMAGRLHRIRDSDISKWAQMGIDWQGMQGEDLIKKGVPQDVVYFMKDLQRIHDSPYFTPPTGAIAPTTTGHINPLQGIIASNPKTAGWLAAADAISQGGKALYDWFSSKNNLVTLRNTLPQDLNAVDRAAYDLVNKDRSAQWTRDDADYINNNIAAHPGLNYGDNPYEKSKPILGPSEPAQTGQTSSEPSVTQPGGFEHIESVPTHRPRRPGPTPTPSTTPSPTPTAATHSFVMPHRGAGLPPGFDVGPGWGTPLNPTILPPAPVANPSQQVSPEIQNPPMSSTGTASGLPVLATNEEYNQLNAGDHFIWQHDGNRYAKT